MRFGTISHREEGIVTLKLLSVPKGQSERFGLLCGSHCLSSSFSGLRSGPRALGPWEPHPEALHECLPLLLTHPQWPLHLQNV